MGARTRRAVSTTIGAAANIPRRVALAPSGLATTNAAMHIAAYSRAPVRTTGAVVTSATTAAAATVHASAPARNGNWPPCGNSRAAAATGARASAVNTANRHDRSCHHHAASATARTTAATGLAGAVATTRTVATT